jgi:hypothetical protein
LKTEELEVALGVRSSHLPPHAEEIMKQFMDFLSRVRDEPYEIGQTVYVWPSHPRANSKRYPATVVHVFEEGSFGYRQRHYVLEVKSVDSYLDIREETLVWEEQ